MTRSLIIDVSSEVMKQIKLKQSGSAILSTEELDISLSFQSTIFSKPLNVYPLTILASPVILSLPIGFFL